LYPVPPGQGRSAPNRDNKIQMALFCYIQQQSTEQQSKARCPWTNLERRNEQGFGVDETAEATHVEGIGTSTVSKCINGHGPIAHSLRQPHHMLTFTRSAAGEPGGQRKRSLEIMTIAGASPALPSTSDVTACICRQRWGVESKGVRDERAVLFVFAHECAYLFRGAFAMPVRIWCTSNIHDLTLCLPMRFDLDPVTWYPGTYRAGLQARRGKREESVCYCQACSLPSSPQSVYR
jgi:hypothetical protein